MVSIGIAAASPPQQVGADANVSVGVGSGSGSGSGSAIAAPSADAGVATTTPAPPPEPPNPDAKGKFNAGGQLRFPSGPDAMGKFGSFNWIAVDAKGRYNVTNFLATYLDVPLAIVHPTLPSPMASAGVFGGVTARGDLGIGKTLGLELKLGFMTDGAFMLSEKDYPYFHGDLKFGVAIGPYLRFHKFGLHITTVPAVAWQDGTGTALQLPLTAMVKVGKLLEVAADAGWFTGKDFKLGATDGDRIYLGASVTAKLGPVLAHVGAGVASLLTGDTTMGAEYGSIKDSIYMDVNVKYAK